MSSRRRISQLDGKINEQNNRRVPAAIQKKRKSEEHAEREKPISICKQEAAEAGFVTFEALCDEQSLSPVKSEENRPDCLCSRIPSNVVVTAAWKRRHQLTCLFPSIRKSCVSPLPLLSWADPKDVWQIMIQKDGEFIRDRHMLNRHPSLQARMRAILLDWLIEVCEVYRLHRETYYLSMDFIDRFLASQVNIPKQQLQLIGITCLFIAAKLEEIYPPKLYDFAYVTDGACTEKEILMQELIILKSLHWNLTPLTVNSWLNIYMQLSNVENIVDTSDTFVFPQYSGHVFVQIAQLIDLCMLDVGCLQFPYRVIAASALLHMTSHDVFYSVTGFELENVSSCVVWLKPFVTAVREAGGTSIKFFNQITEDDMHNIQTHSTTLELLDAAQAKQNQIVKSSYNSPVTSCSALLTPPQSLEKSVVSWS